MSIYIDNLSLEQIPPEHNESLPLEKLYADLEMQNISYTIGSSFQPRSKRFADSTTKLRETHEKRNTPTING